MFRQHRPVNKDTRWMRSSQGLDRLDAAFDGATRLVGDAGPLLPATVAHHLGLTQLAERFLNLGDRPGQANRGDKLSSCRRSRLATA
jgi:hypothetical protein